jgi:hypothetical protein
VTLCNLPFPCYFSNLIFCVMSPCPFCFSHTGYSCSSLNVTLCSHSRGFWIVRSLCLNALPPNILMSSPSIWHFLKPVLKYHGVCVFNTFFQDFIISSFNLLSDAPGFLSYYLQIMLFFLIVTFHFFLFFDLAELANILEPINVEKSCW